MSATQRPWAETDAVRELQEAAAECGFRINPLAKTEAEWGLATADRLRLLQVWSAKMRARCGLAEVPTIAEGARKPVAPRSYSPEGRVQRWGRDVTPEQIAAVLPNDPAMAISVGEINRRLNRAETRDPRQVKRALTALAGRGVAAQTNDWPRARNRVYATPQARWYRVA